MKKPKRWRYAPFLALAVAFLCRIDKINQGVHSIRNTGDAQILLILDRGAPLLVIMTVIWSPLIHTTTIRHMATIVECLTTFFTYYLVVTLGVKF